MSDNTPEVVKKYKNSNTTMSDLDFYKQVFENSMNLGKELQKNREKMEAFENKKRKNQERDKIKTKKFDQALEVLDNISTTIKKL